LRHFGNMIERMPARSAAEQPEEAADDTIARTAKKAARTASANGAAGDEASA
jgi:hypothetical protein